MKRPLLVDQRENDKGHFWYVVRGGNRQVLTTSEMYLSRDGALRAARNFIELIAPVQVEFSYWAGDRPRLDRFGMRRTDLDRKLVRELIR
ncbi:YegP family protein [Mycolicibacter heraklionensis]|uniref:YegP family protein n=1 Tax=Mycolicibacter heraklionensis TaxID=512402 RepID=UPI0007EBF973|nr:YegP family protein [Mycolicibacter heraklionensis]OBG32385.1 hypothetical protein A5671_07585 [Mycolicibacter heraklionensis]